jgi:hypothetical protein
MGLAGSSITLSLLIYHRLTMFSGNSKSAEGNLVGVRPPSRHLPFFAEAIVFWARGPNRGLSVFPARSRAIISIAERWSALLTMAYRRNFEGVFHPTMAIMTDSGTPARRAALAAERRKSWGISPTYLRTPPHSHFTPARGAPHFPHSIRPVPARTHRFLHAPRKSLIGFPSSRVNMASADFFSATAARSSSSTSGDFAAFAVLRWARIETDGARLASPFRVKCSRPT